MINILNIHNFKNHKDTSLKLGKLTLLTGANGAGKSSVIQSLLMLRDSYLQRGNLNALITNGPSFKLGQPMEAINFACENKKDELNLSLDIDGRTFAFSFQYPAGTASSLKRKDTNNYSRGTLDAIPLFNDNFQYLSAFRVGPLPMYSLDTDVVDEHRQVSSQRGLGDMAVYFLSHFGEETIPVETLCYDAQASHDLRTQTELWMAKISDDIQIKIDQLDSNFKLMIGYRQKNRPTRYYSAMNTGYGISYVLSIIVAVLTAKPGALILIENPEAHIHPSAQSALMDLICRAAHAGIQIIIETHSDHIVNGALVKAKQGRIGKEELSLYYMDRDETNSAYPIALHIGDDGRVKDTPRGFFDQMDADLDVLFDL